MNRLNKADKKKIQELCKFHSQSQLARMFKVSQATINKHLNIYWKGLEKGPESPKFRSLR